MRLPRGPSVVCLYRTYGQAPRGSCRIMYSVMMDSLALRWSSRSRLPGSRASRLPASRLSACGFLSPDAPRQSAGVRGLAWRTPFCGPAWPSAGFAGSRVLHQVQWPVAFAGPAASGRLSGRRFALCTAPCSRSVPAHLPGLAGCSLLLLSANAGSLLVLNHSSFSLSLSTGP